MPLDVSRAVTVLPKLPIGPVTKSASSAFSVAVGEQQWIARLDPLLDYPSAIWTVTLEWSFDNGATWSHWRSVTGTTITPLPEKPVYPSIGGTFPDAKTQPTHLRSIVSFDRTVTCGLTAEGKA